MPGPSSSPARSTVIPALRYRDAPAAIEWLCRVIGFDKHLVVPGPAGTIAHAQLSLGGGMLMLGSVDNGSEFGRRIRQPDEIGGFETQCAYVVVPDVDVVHERARAEGRGARRARLRMPRSRRASLVPRQLRSLGVKAVARTDAFD